MRKTVLAGLVLAVAAPLVVLLSGAFGLDLNSVVLLGTAVGAVVALVPDRGPGLRLVGFLAGFVVSLLGYIFRAAVLPDTNGGLAVYVGVVVAACVLLSLVTRDRLPLWSLLLGAGGFVGAYEHVYAAAPPQVVSTSVSTATQLLLAVGIGFLAAAVVAPDRSAAENPSPRPARPGTDANDQLDDLMMETAK